MTIVAAASAPGHAPRAVVRVAGDLAPIASIVRPLPDHRGVARALVDLGSARLPCLALRFVAPGSYTGEDAIELLVPGSPAVVDRVLAALLAQPGVRPAEPGEFSARAFLAGRLTIDEAHGVEATISAQSAEQLEAARRLLDGSLGRRALGWSDRLAHALAMVEAGIDFADQEDVTAIEPADLRALLEPIDASIAAELGASAGVERAIATPRAILAGVPSAGKSTLFNALLGRRRVLVAADPGTTRDVIVEPIELAPGLVIELADAAGLDASDSAAQRAALRAIDEADIVLWCDESGRFAEPPQSRGVVIRVRTKADRPVTGDPAGGVRPVVEVCGLTGAGLATLRAALQRAADSLRPASGLPHSVAAALASVRTALARALSASSIPGAPSELIASELREALDQLGGITGRVDPDTVLGLIFSRFCVGK